MLLGIRNVTDWLFQTLVECHPAGINTHTTLNMPDCVSEEARSLIQQVIELTPGVSTSGLHISRAHCSKAMRKLFGGGRDSRTVTFRVNMAHS